MPGRLKGYFKRVLKSPALLFGRLRLVQKLMLVYSLVLGVTILTFATQLINVANNSTEQAFLNDTQKLLKESKYDIDNKIDICYRAVSALSGDYDLMSYFRDWDRGDGTTIVNFSVTLRRRFEQIRFLSPDIYQFRLYVGNSGFPEIGSDVYSYERLAGKKELLNKLEQNPDGYWLVNHPEDNYNLAVLERRKVVSLYARIGYLHGESLGTVEVSMPVETFFRHMFSQTENKNLLAFVVDGDGNIIFDPGSGFAARYGMNGGNLSALLKGLDFKPGGSGAVPMEIDKIHMNLVYDYIEQTGCAICYIVTNENITRSLADTKKLILAESVASLILLSVLIYFLTRFIFKKMKQIIASMRKVEEGKLDIRVSITGQDEINEVAYHFNRMVGKVEDLISEVISKQEAKKDAEIRALFSQINSHFITNTLENIRMLAEVEGKFEMADAIASLGKLLRYGLKWSSGYAMLAEELEYIKNYIVLSNIRYDYAISLKTDIPAEFMSYRVLKVSLQPVVENAIHRGIEPLSRDGTVTIRVFADLEYTFIEITDNGAGMDEERLEKVRLGIRSENVPEEKGSGRSGIGLRNVNERIRLVFGERYGLDITSEKGSFTRVTMRLPAVLQPQ